MWFEKQTFRKRTLTQSLLDRAASVLGATILLVKILKLTWAVYTPQGSKMNNMLKRHKKPLMNGGGAVAGAAGLGALLSK